MKRLLPLLAASVLGCSALQIDEIVDDRVSPAAREFPQLDPGAKELVSMHFEVSAYGSDTARDISELSERLYARLMADTGLYSFLPSRPYRITIYGSREEYLAKTGLPAWSGGVAAGSAIYAYEDPRLPGVLAHEMTHLIFREYLGRDDISLRWVNEGLAVYEEQEALAATGIASAAPPGRWIPFQEMILLAPMDENARDVSDWYRQVGSVVRYMIERGGRVGFGQFMRALKDGQRAGDALRTGFPAHWRSLDELENAWGGGR